MQRWQTRMVDQRELCFPEVEELRERAVSDQQDLQPPDRALGSGACRRTSKAIFEKALAILWDAGM